MAETVPSQEFDAPGPHAGLHSGSGRELFCCRLFDRLWHRYRQRVEYASAYERVVAGASATFVNDHIAFRTFASQRPATGIATLSRIFEALGYRAAGCYQFPDKQLAAIHWQHGNPRFPKLFISELQLWLLPEEPRRIVLDTLASHRPLPDERLLAGLATLDEPGGSEPSELLPAVVDFIERLPWDLPDRQNVERLNRFSQYAAWVLVHGYNVNHFTSLINSHQVDGLRDIEQTVAALRRAGVPMKAEIEGLAGSKLRQTATEAVVIDVPVREGGQAATMPWTYAYFELAERGDVVDAESGARGRFEGFLGPQATQLFEMTRRAT
ncbi:MAG: DUF1338 domain-containing protein [Pirellulaceae bacterium]|nr:DUF1338 domain-containing protein [Pirellulaceae bacterium]